MTSITKADLCHIFSECEKALQFTNTHLKQQQCATVQPNENIIINLPCIHSDNSINKAKAVLRKKLKRKKLTL